MCRCGGRVGGGVLHTSVGRCGSRYGRGPGARPRGGRCPRGRRRGHRPAFNQCRPSPLRPALSASFPLTLGRRPGSTTAAGRPPPRGPRPSAWRCWTSSRSGGSCRRAYAELVFICKGPPVPRAARGGRAGGPAAQAGTGRAPASGGLDRRPGRGVGPPRPGACRAPAAQAPGGCCCRPAQPAHPWPTRVWRAAPRGSLGPPRCAPPPRSTIASRSACGTRRAACRPRWSWSSCAAPRARGDMKRPDAGLPRWMPGDRPAPHVTGCRGRCELPGHPVRSPHRPGRARLLSSVVVNERLPTPRRGGRRQQSAVVLRSGRSKSSACIVHGRPSASGGRNRRRVTSPEQGPASKPCLLLLSSSNRVIKQSSVGVVCHQPLSAPPERERAPARH
jgi:hypothetical protein